MLELIKDMFYRKVGLFPPDLPHIKTLDTPNKWMRESIANLGTVCLFLGPNRNLTTLTASVLALHPNCQVLSHAGNRILPFTELNFFNEYSEEKFINFCHFAIVMSQNGDKGSYGGSIVMTHAFRNHKKIMDVFRKRFGRQLVRKNIQCLVWKDAHRVDDYVVENKVNLFDLMVQIEKLRFLMPVRNPIDVALSFSVQDGIRKKYFTDYSGQDTELLLDRILEKMERVIRLRNRNPDRVMVFYEHEIGPRLFTEIARFLKLEPTKQWIQDSASCFDVRPSGYRVSRALLDYYETRISERFADLPETLLDFRRYSANRAAQ